MRWRNETGAPAPALPMLAHTRRLRLQRTGVGTALVRPERRGGRAAHRIDGALAVRAARGILPAMNDNTRTTANRAEASAYDGPAL